MQKWKAVQTMGLKGRRWKQKTEIKVIQVSGQDTILTSVSPSFVR